MTEKLLPTLIFSACFLGFFAFLLGMAPVYLIEGIDIREMEYPEYFPSEELVMFTDTVTHNVTSVIYLDDDYELGGHNFMIRIDSGAGVGQNEHYIVNCHFYYFLIFAHGFHSFEWYNDRGLKVSELGPANVYGTWGTRNIITRESVIENYDNTSDYAKFTERCDHVTFVSFIFYNTTAYGSMAQAWDNSTFWVTQAINFDQIGTAWNAWSMITNLLFFQAPSIHPFVNLIIALPFWVCIAYLIYRMVLLALPFVG